MTIPAVDVVTAGEAMVLLLADPPQPLRSAVAFRRSIAGAESNVAIGLARLGRAVRWIGVIGDDPLGDAVEALVRGEGVDVSYVRRDVAPTGVLVRDAPRGLPVQVVYHRRHAAGAHLGPTDVPDAAVVGARMVHLTGITPALSASCAAAVEALARRGRAAGAEVVFDPNHRAKLWSPQEARRSLDELSRLSDVVLVGMDEGVMLTGADSVEDLAGWFLQRGVTLVVVKHGAAGAWATDGATTWETAGRPVRSVDVVGAGDAFAAAFLATRLDGGGVERCLLAGNAAGALAVQVYGDIEGLPTRAELDAYLREEDDVDR